jgi:hypothetical protein
MVQGFEAESRLKIPQNGLKERITKVCSVVSSSPTQKKWKNISKKRATSPRLCPFGLI